MQPSVLWLGATFCSSLYDATICYPEVAEVVKGDVIIWPTPIVMILVVECAIVVLAIAFAFAMQTRKRDLV